MKRKILIAVPLLCLVALIAWLLRPKHEKLGEAFVSERSVTLWSSVAQVREALVVLHYGDRVDVVSRRNDSVKVRTAAGQVGWLDGRLLMEPAFWQRSIKLLEQVRAMPVQARGRTKVATNLRVEPGRTAQRIYQFGRNVPLEIVGRAVADWAQVSDEKDSAGDSEPAKKEDWFLVRGVATRPPGEAAARTAETSNTAPPGDAGANPIAGWVVGRFIELDLPDQVREGTASAGMRPIAWFEINRVADPSGEKPQYLVAGVRGAEGQLCDFTTLRVFTWHVKKSRYETAYIENNLCGQLPVRLAKSAKGEPEFRFREMGVKKDERVYRMMQTVVRRIREDDGTSRAHSAASKKPASKR